MEFFDSFFFEWLAISIVMFMAIISPGPDFIIVVRNAIMHSRKSGFYTVGGISSALIIHMTYCSLGLSAMIASSVTLFSIIKYIGAAYLIYIGVKALRSKGFSNKEFLETDAKNKTTQRSNAKSWQDGFLTNLLNPKATMFFFALFTQIIQPGTPKIELAIYGATNIILASLWFIGVTMVLTDTRIQTHFVKFSKWIDRITGGLLIALGIKLALSKG